MKAKKTQSKKPVNTRSKKSPRSRIRFLDDETETLLAIWASTEIQTKFNSFQRHAAIWDEIASELYSGTIDDDGDPVYPKRSGTNCKDRILNLKKEYTKRKTAMTSGAAAPTKAEFKFWDKFEQVFGSRDCMSTKNAMDTMELPTSTDVDANTGDSEDQLDSEHNSLVDEHLSDEPSVSTPNAVHFQGRQSHRRNRKNDSETFKQHTVLQEMLDVQKSNSELSKQRIEEEKELMKAMTGFFSAGMQYFATKAAAINLQN